MAKGITGNNNEDFYCLNYFRGYVTKNRLEKHKKVSENHDYCRVEMPKEDDKILKFNHGGKSMNAPFFIYFNFECLPEKINTCHNNPEKLSATKINNHTPSGYSLFTCYSFNAKKNKLDCYRGADCMKKFCIDLKKHVERIINYENKYMIPLTKKNKKCMMRQNLVTYVKKDLVLMVTTKSIIK